MRAYSRGDASAFDMLYSRYKDILFNSLCNQLGSSHFAEEVAQEVWMAIIHGASAFTEQETEQANSFKSWLFSIAHRRAADFWRKRYKENRVSETENSEHQVIDAPDNNLANEPENHQLINEFRQLLQKLPEEQRQTFILREEGFSYQEIAAITEVGVETVKSRLRYAKSTLKDWLGDNHD